MYSSRPTRIARLFNRKWIIVPSESHSRKIVKLKFVSDVRENFCNDSSISCEGIFLNSNGSRMLCQEKDGKHAVFRVRDMSKGRIEFVSSDFHVQVLSLRISQSEDLVATVFDNCDVSIWCLKKGKIVKEWREVVPFDTRLNFSGAISPCLTWFLFASGRGDVKWFCTKGGEKDQCKVFDLKVESFSVGHSSRFEFALMDLPSSPVPTLVCVIGMADHLSFGISQTGLRKACPN